MTEPAIIEAKPGELLPCPFCGSECAFEHDTIGLAHWRVYCRDPDNVCVIGLAASRGYPRRVEAATAWNKRHTLERFAPTDPTHTVRIVIAMLPDDKDEGLRILDAARRMVERFKR